jgi:hypothetical protein
MYGDVMVATKYTYDITNDFPNGKINLSTFQEDITSSSIITALDRIDTAGGTIAGDVLTGGAVDIWFKAALSAGDETTLHGDIIGPAGGLIAAHDNAPTQDPLAVEVKNSPSVSIPDVIKATSWKPDQANYKRIYVFSCDFNKKETWYNNSSTNSESFDADGVQNEFGLAYGSGNGAAIIDLCHGKVTDEYALVNPSGDSYVPVVKINGAVQTEREAFESIGGHYEIDYIAGKLKFYAAPPSGNEVTIDYHYSPSGHGPRVEAGPSAGKKWTINFAEVQFSVDTIMKDTFLQNAIIDYPVFVSGVYSHTIPDMKVGPDTPYLTGGNFLDYTNGSFPIIPAFGGSERGTTEDTLIFRWDYASSMELVSSLNARFLITTKHNRGFEGERVVITIYGVEEDE